jgi:hypothetical protein
MPAQLGSCAGIAVFRGVWGEPPEGARGCVVFAATAAWARQAPTPGRQLTNPGGAGGEAPAGAKGQSPWRTGRGGGGGGEIPAKTTPNPHLRTLASTQPRTHKEPP